MVDVEHLAVNHQGGDGLHSRLVGFGHPALRLTEMHILDRESQRVEGGGDGLLRLGTDRATGVVENCLLHHLTPQGERGPSEPLDTPIVRGSI